MQFAYDPSMAIHTERLLLRAFTLGDIPAMLKNWAADPDVQKEYGEPVYATAEAAASLLRMWEGQYRWAIILKGSGENIGHISFCRVYLQEKVGEVEYCIGKAYWGQGLAPEAARAFLHHTFLHTPIERVEAFHRRANPGSGRVLQKAGMQPVDTVMRFSNLSAPPAEDICYAITREQFLQSQEA